MKSREPTSFKKIAARENDRREYKEVTRHGKKYGYSPRKDAKKHLANDLVAVIAHPQ
jgi:hypothetical protein